MRLTEKIFSTLKTWVFKKKLLRFSGRYRWGPEACFYCPEMCRFACPVAETLRNNTVTPRGKMSLLHLTERGFASERVTGGDESRLWFLEQCTGCGRCTEYCVYENDVAAQLRDARVAHFTKVGAAEPVGSELVELRRLRGVVLLCEEGRRDWWLGRRDLLEELGTTEVAELRLPHRDWAWGKLSDARAKEIGSALSGCTQLWVESPEAAWFLAKGVKELNEALKPEVRVVWQRFFATFSARELGPGVSFHESWHLSRLFPRLGYSIPMHERGLLPFHHGWNALDCGGEGFYPVAYPGVARGIGLRFLEDLVKDGRPLERVVCQSLSCVEHLKGLTEAKVTYWLDELVRPHGH